MRVAVTKRVEVMKTYFVEVADDTKDEDLMDAVAGKEGEHEPDWDNEDEPQTVYVCRLGPDGEEIHPPAAVGE